VPENGASTVYSFMISDMATLAVEGSDLVVRLVRLERLAAMRRCVRVPVAAIRSVEVTPDPYGTLRGVRAPGTGVPGLIAYGVRRMTGGRPDFAAVAGRRPVIVIALGEGSPFERLIVSAHDPAAVASEVRTAAGLG
jgi:hypothetical protein